MEHVDQSYQNGHTNIYKEVNEDGTVTEYQAEQYIIEEDDAEMDSSVSPEVVVLQDSEDMKVYQQHEVLDDGREMIITTTITLDENGDAVEETVTEIVESEEVDVSEEEEEETEGGVVEHTASVQQTSVAGTAVDEEVEREDERPTTPLVEVERGMASAAQEEQEEEQEAQDSMDPEAGAVEHELVSPEHSVEDEDSQVKAVSRRISYEEFAEQYTEYKPPKRYEKKQQSKAADKAAPKIRIMPGEGDEDDAEVADGQGLPNTDFYSTAPATSAEPIGSPRGSSHGEESMSEEPNTSQPTRTQGSVIRRMDQDNNVDPTNVVRADDKPDLEAELPSRGTSKSLKSKFQSLDGGQAAPVDFSQPIKRERPRTGQFGYSTTPVVSADGEGVESTHHEPEFEGGEIENTPTVRDDVVREADRNDEVELPEIGQAKNLLSKWSQLETESSKRKEYKPSGVGSKPTVTPLRPTYVEVVNTGDHVEPELEGGEYENTPVQRTDVIKETDTVALEDELPTIGQAKSLMSQFREREQQAKNTPVYQPSGAGSRAPKVKSRPTSVSSVEPHVEPQFEGGEVENTPIVRPDVVRESDRSDEQELPEVGYANNLKARFKELQEQQKPSDYVEHRPSGVASKATPTPIRSGHTNIVNAPIINSSDEPARVEPEPEGGEYENEPVRRTDVIREEDGTDEQELPEAGLAKNLMDRFTTLEREKPPTYTPSGVGAKATPSKLHIMAGKTAYSAKGFAPEPVVNSNSTDDDPAFEAGEYENTPTTRDDVVRADTRNDEGELPEQGVTRNIMSRFKSIEDDNKSDVQHRPSTAASKPTPTPLRPKSANSVETVDTVSDASSLEQLEYESVPEINHNVVRSSDTHGHDYVPSAGAAKSLMDKFRQLETQKSDKVEHRPSKVASSLTPTPLQLKR